MYRSWHHLFRPQGCALIRADVPFMDQNLQLTIGTMHMPKTPSKCPKLHISMILDNFGLSKIVQTWKNTYVFAVEVPKMARHFPKFSGLWPKKGGVYCSWTVIFRPQRCAVIWPDVPFMGCAVIWEGVTIFLCVEFIIIHVYTPAR